MSLFLLFPINIPRLQIPVIPESEALGNCPQSANSPLFLSSLQRAADTSLPAYVNRKHAASYVSFVSPGKQHFTKQLQAREGGNASDVLHRGYLEIRGATVAERKSPKKMCQFDCLIPMSTFAIKNQMETAGAGGGEDQTRKKIAYTSTPNASTGEGWLLCPSGSFAHRDAAPVASVGEMAAWSTPLLNGLAP